METKKFKLGLVPKLIIAIILGILIGQLMPEPVCRLVVTLSGFFSNFLKFVIPLMILAYVTMGIADLTQGAGKLLLITVAIAYGSTLIAGSASYLVSSSLFPSFMSADAMAQIAATAGISLAPYFSISIPPILDTLSAVVLAFILGLCLSTMRCKEIGQQCEGFLCYLYFRKTHYVCNEKSCYWVLFAADYLANMVELFVRAFLRQSKIRRAADPADSQCCHE